MTKLRKIYLVGVMVALVGIGLSAGAQRTSAQAAQNYYCTQGQNTQYDPTSTDPKKNTPCISNDKIPDNKDNAATNQACTKNSCNLITKYINPAINFLAGATAVVVTISIVVGGIQYATSAGDPGKAAKARSRIFNAVFALLAFIFLYAILNWLIPGGLL